MLIDVCFFSLVNVITGRYQPTYASSITIFHDEMHDPL